MKEWPFCLSVNLILAVGIIFCALLGSSLGIQGPALAISVVWPATGLSLAALLLFGYKAWVGVFLGNLVYNVFFISRYPSTIAFTPFYLHGAPFFIALGSLAQALISTYIIRTYSTPLFFRSVQDIFIFLIPASLFSCLIGSTIGVGTLIITGGLATDLILPVWLTFWLGDTVGIYVITSLIVVWTLLPKEVRLIDHLPSAIIMTTLFVIFSFITYYFDYPLPHLFVPISIWAAYLFRMHGASLAIFLMTAASIAFAASHGYEGTSLISLITFIAVTIGASLIIAAVANERAYALALLDARNLYLEKEVDVKVDILEHVRSEVIQKRKHATQSSASEHLILKIHPPLTEIDSVITNAQEALEDLHDLLTKKINLTHAERKIFEEKLDRIKSGLSETMVSQKLIEEILKSLNTS